jgi:hypothetical protein
MKCFQMLKLVHVAPIVVFECSCGRRAIDLIDYIFLESLNGVCKTVFFNSLKYNSSMVNIVGFSREKQKKAIVNFCVEHFGPDYYNVHLDSAIDFFKKYSVVEGL